MRYWILNNLWCRKFDKKFNKIKMSNDFSRISYVKLLRPRCWNVLYVIYIYFFNFIKKILLLSLKTKIKKNKLNTGPKWRERKWRRDQIWISVHHKLHLINHCLDFMEYIIFYCWLSQLMGIFFAQWTITGERVLD